MIRTVVLGGLLLAALASPAGAQTNKEGKAALYKTPEECFDASEAAAIKGDFKTAVACLAPQCQKEMAALSAVTLVGLRTLLGAAKEKDAEATAKAFKPVFDALDRHGLTEKATSDIKESKDPKVNQKAQEAALALIKDPAAFLVDSLSVLAKLEDLPKQKARVIDVKIIGDKATATVVRKTAKGKEKKEPISFLKINNSWRMIQEIGPSSSPPDDKKDDKNEKKPR